MQNNNILFCNAWTLSLLYFMEEKRTPGTEITYCICSSCCRLEPTHTEFLFVKEWWMCHHCLHTMFFFSWRIPKLRLCTIRKWVGENEAYSDTDHTVWSKGWVMECKAYWMQGQKLFPDSVTMDVALAFLVCHCIFRKMRTLNWMLCLGQIM